MLQQTVRSLVAASRLSAGWHVEVAAMLSQVGCVILPPSTLEKFDQRKPLNPGEEEMIRRMPAVVEQVPGNIPRLEPVREILRFQDKHFDGQGLPDGMPGFDAIPWGARALKVALDLDAIESEGLPLSLAFDRISSASSSPTTLPNRSDVVLIATGECFTVRNTICS